MAKVGFIGLGRMGAGMARNLIKGGHALTVFDVSPGALRPFAESGAHIASCSRDAATGADFVITMLPNSRAVRQTVLGDDGAIDGMPSGSVLIDMSTGGFEDALDIARELNRRGHAFIDAPVGRTPWDAEAGTLMILAGGTTEDIERARSLFECMGNELVHAGPVGSGVKLKLVNNYLTVVGSALVAETLTLGRKVGLDRDLLVRVLRSTVAGKGPLNVLYPKKVLAGDITPLFSGRLAHKDLVLALELANSVGSPLPLGAAARELYSLGQAYGRLDDDMTALLLVLESASLATTDPSQTTSGTLYNESQPGP